MKQIIFLLAFLFSVSIGFATSSEDIYTLEQACALSHGSHLGQITSLQNDSRFRDTIENSEYSIGSFWHIDDNSWGDSIFFVANNNGTIGTQKYSELFLVNCSPSSGQTVHFPIHRVEPGIQYSPEIINITDTNILLDDYQNMNGKSVHVSNIFDRKSSTFHLIRDEAIKSVKIIKAFSRNRQIFWNILDYNVNTKSIKLEVRVSPSIKRNFTIKL